MPARKTSGHLKKINEKRTPAEKSMHHLRSSLRLAQEMGKSLGRSKVLQRTVQAE